jgi:hypothetical protein
MSEDKPALPEWMRDCIAAVPDDVVRSIVADNQRSPKSTPAAPAEPKAAGPGVVAIGPRPASEVELMDRIVERFAGGPNNIK